MQNRHPLASLIALAAISMLNQAAAQEAAAPAKQPAAPSATTEGAPKQAATAAPVADHLDPFIDALLASAPMHHQINQRSEVPRDIAERAGLYAPDFDQTSLKGRTAVLLAAALSNLRELRTHCEPTGVAKCQMADQNIGAALAALQLLESVPQATAA